MRSFGSWLGLLLPLALACGGGGAIKTSEDEGKPPPDAAADLAPDAATGEDGPGLPDAPEDARPEAADGVEDPSPEGPPDVTAEAGDPGPDGLPPGCPGKDGCPCKDAGDCNSGQCMETAQGWRCAALCATGESCPEGWACVTVSGGGSDVVTACADPFARLCRPCRLDSDCTPAVEVPGRTHACVDLGPDGRFCGVSCDGDDDCPDGHQCVAGSAGKKHCRPAGGAACECTDYFAEAGFVTTCFVANEAGKCLAERTCDQPCPARTPVAEACNADDDDCDGKTDEDVPVTDCPLTNAYGTCTGKTLCGPGGQVQCQGTYASPEFCNTFDDDCDGKADPPGTPGCKDYIKDADQDGWGADGDTLCLCKASTPYTATVGGDCDDEEPLSRPGLPEVCDGLDNDCDGNGDTPDTPGCTTHWRDADGDGHGDVSVTACLCGPGGGWVANADDCDDADGARHPGADERCNGIDDDCDDALPADERDGDDDGVMACEGDCDDSDPEAFPMAPERCNGMDDDCDDALPPDEVDGDQDGSLPCQGDCADGDPTRHPGAEEACDRVDQDCDGTVDEGCLAAAVREEFVSATLGGTSGDVVVHAAAGVPGAPGLSVGPDGSVCIGVLCAFD